ncbi:MAG: monothiol glutaredoxin, Grx4 family, partial [Myxococcales bacterium]|nr:monothiol glutaredoxin, Grx4 family [Myxococcales bacterium]
HRSAPQCGFSATVVDVLDDYLDDYATVNVLADPEVREGIKAFGDWPTIPQLYVRGELVGGADIIKDLVAAGELEEVLGAVRKPLQTPEITLTDAAVAALAEHWEEEGPPRLRLEIDGSFRAALFFDSPKDDDLVMEDARVVLLVDRSTARRSDGVVIDWVTTAQGAGFKIDNPQEPPRVRPLAPADLKRMMDEGKPLEVFDVRTEEERARAHIEGSHFLDGDGRTYLGDLSRDTAVVFYCHHGIRSQAAAEHGLRMGFREVYNLSGGIDAWSASVDPAVPRY